MTESETDTPPQTESAEKSAPLSHELSEFLVQLSIAVRRYAIYPPDHPSLGPAVTNVMRCLGPLFQERSVLQIGVAGEQLVIEGFATDVKHPVLRELGRLLHDLQLGAITFTVGVASQEVEGLLQTLSREAEGDEPPLGLLPPRQRPTWDHIAIYPVGYDQLHIQEGSADRATELWLGLAQAAMAGDEPLDPGGSARPQGARGDHPDPRTGNRPTTRPSWDTCSA